MMAASLQSDLHVKGKVIDLATTVNDDNDKEILNLDLSSESILFDEQSKGSVPNTLEPGRPGSARHTCQRQFQGAISASLVYHHEG